MEKVRTDLDRYKSLLDSQVASLINKDYADFVELAASVRGADGAVIAVRQALERVHNEVATAASAAEERSARLVEREERLRCAVEERKALESLLEAAEALEELERAGGSDDWLVAEGGSERTAALAAALRRQRKSSGLPPALSQRADVAEAKLIDRLRQPFGSAASVGDAEKMQRCLRVYQALGRRTDASKAIMGAVGFPLVEKHMTASAVEGGKRASLDGLKNVLENLVSVVEKGIAKSAWLLDESDGELVLQAVFDEISEQLHTRHGAAMLATGIPEAFRANYTRWHMFLQLWERTILSSDAKRVARFRSSSMVRKWQTAWKVEVYFTLRSQECIRQIESVLQISGPVAVGAAIDANAFALAPLTSCWNIVRKSWAPDFFLPGLSGSILRLSFQMVTRMRLWTLGALPSSSLTSQWADVTIQHFFACAHDLSVLSKLVRKDLTTLIADATSQDVPECVSRAANVASEECENDEKLFLKHAVSIVSSDCCNALQYVRKISSVCFRPDAPMPEAALADVDSVVAPLRKAMLACRDLTDPIQFGSQVAADILKSFKDIAAEVLVQAQATQKFIAQRQKGSEGPSGISKIVAQCKLDVKKLDAILTELKIQQPALMEQLLQAILV